jgi:hypothetical protein
MTLQTTVDWNLKSFLVVGFFIDPIWLNDFFLSHHYIDEKWPPLDCWSDANHATNKNRRDKSETRRATLYCEPNVKFAVLYICRLFRPYDISQFRIGAFINQPFFFLEGRCKGYKYLQELTWVPFLTVFQQNNLKKRKKLNGLVF